MCVLFLDITHMWVDINTLNHSLAAGESFEVPGFFVSAFEGDWDDAAYATHQVKKTPPYGIS